MAVETARHYLKHYPGVRGADAVVEKPSRRIDAVSVEGFVTRVLQGKPENVGVRGPHSTLTAILGRIAADERREVTWEEMMKSAWGGGDWSPRRVLCCGPRGSGGLIPRQCA